jgi:hypothetical protein
MEIRAAFERSPTPHGLTTLGTHVMDSSIISPVRQDGQTGREMENLLRSLSLRSSRHSRPSYGRPTQPAGAPQDRFTFQPRGPVYVSRWSCAADDPVTCRIYDYGQTAVQHHVETDTIALVPDSVRRR